MGVDGQQQDKMIKAGVLGYPAKHSLSPLIHNYWVAECGLSGRYDCLETAPENLKQSFQTYLAQGYSGFNVTVPFKQEIMAFCDELEQVAKAIGAVNTIYKNEHGRLVGTNTDAYGFMANLKQQVPGLDLKNKKALILGAGGAARAVAYALTQEGARVSLANRTTEKAQELAATFDGEVVPWAERESAASSCDVLVNTTTLGMVGQPALDFDAGVLKEEAVVYDIVYKPLFTPLLAAAQERGLVVVTGLGMLVHQAVPGFARWFGVEPVVTPDLQTRLLDALNAR